ncbi:MAG: SsrA-binding protein [Phycisphaerales bacterium]
MAKKGKSAKGAPTIENRQARHNYFVDDTLEVGIKLQGSEVKSIRAGNCSIAEGYVTAQAEPARLTLHGINVGVYGPAGQNQHPAVRNRVLLAHKREIVKLARQVDQKGVTIVPLKLYFKNGMAKLLIQGGAEASGRTTSGRRSPTGTRSGIFSGRCRGRPRGRH